MTLPAPPCALSPACLFSPLTPLATHPCVDRLEHSPPTQTLLLAIGECVETPFRVMDEPDVCMDAHSRDTSIQLLLKTCVDARNRQFILITPQDVSMVRRHADFIDDLPDDFIRFQVVQKRDDM